MITLLLSQALVLSSTPRPEIDVNAYIMSTDWPQLIISICSILIAFISIVYTSLSYYQQKKYNKAVFRPFVNIVVTVSAQRFELCLKSAGLGPAMIKSFSIEKDSHQYESAYAFYQSFEQQMGGCVKLLPRTQCQEGMVLNPTESITLFGIDKTRYDDKSDDFKRHLDILKKYFHNSKVTVMFQDVEDDTRSAQKCIQKCIKKCTNNNDKSIRKSEVTICTE